MRLRALDRALSRDRYRESTCAKVSSERQGARLFIDNHKRACHFTNLKARINIDVRKLSFFRFFIQISKYHTELCALLLVYGFSEFNKLRVYFRNLRLNRSVIRLLRIIA